MQVRAAREGLVEKHLARVIMHAHHLCMDTNAAYGISYIVLMNWSRFFTSHHSTYPAQRDGHAGAANKQASTASGALLRLYSARWSSMSSNNSPIHHHNVLASGDFQFL